MTSDGSLPRPQTAAELDAELAAERSGLPFLMLRDGEGFHHVVPLGPGDRPVWVGRRPSADVCIAWDLEVSGVHAKLEPSVGEWTLVDDGLSRNGSFVGGERVAGHRRLRDGDVVRFGSTLVVYRQPYATVRATLAARAVSSPASLTETQRRVLVALCRPFKDSTHATPATNKQIAAEVFLSVDAVKVHLRTLCAKFGVEDLPQNAKRTALVERAMLTGVVSKRDL